MRYSLSLSFVNIFFQCVPLKYEVNFKQDMFLRRNKTIKHTGLNSGGCPEGNGGGEYGPPIFPKDGP